MASREADGTFTSATLNYPNTGNVIPSAPTDGTSTPGTVEEFLGVDWNSFALRTGATAPGAFGEELQKTVWRFTGFLNLPDGDSIDVRVYSDDGAALWVGDNVVGSGTVGDLSAFKYKGRFEDCCTPTLTGSASPQPFQLWFWEDGGNTGLRLDFSVQGENDFAALGGDFLLRNDGFGVIPLPATAWLLISGLLGLGALGHKRRLAGT